jgi:hypothetical protein
MKIFHTCLLTLALLSSGCSGFMMQSNRESTTTEPISSSSYKVTFCGAGYMPKAKARTMALQQASQLTLKKGYTHFTVFDRSDRSEMNQLEDISRKAYLQGVKPTPEESLAGQQNLMRPKIVLKIQLFNQADAPAKAINAKQYLTDNPIE